MERRFQFSLRALLIAMTLVAVVVATVANHPKVAVTLVLFILCLLDLAGWISWMVSIFGLEDLQGPMTTEEVRRERSKWQK